MFITKIIKSKKVGCLLKLNITASTLYCTQAMENEFKNEIKNKLKAYSNIVESANSENKFINKTQYKFILIEDLNDIRFNKDKIKGLNDIRFNKEGIGELKDMNFNYEKIEELNELKLIEKDKNINIYNDNGFLNYNNEIAGGIGLSKEKEDDKSKNKNEFKKVNSTGSFVC